MFIFSHLASKQPRVPLTPVQRRKIAIFLIVLGAMIELGGAGFLLYTGAWFERTVVAQGMVTDHLTHRGSKGSVSYSEVVVFSTPSGAVITFNDSYSSSLPHAKGVSVPVLYDAGDPSSASIDEWHRIWMFPSLVFALGLVVFGVGWMLYIEKVVAQA
jgi:Protein of unknown function (DUF3592)